MLRPCVVRVVTTYISATLLSLVGAIACILLSEVVCCLPLLSVYTSTVRRPFTSASVSFLPFLNVCSLPKELQCDAQTATTPNEDVSNNGQSSDPTLTMTTTTPNKDVSNNGQSSDPTMTKDHDNTQ